MAQEKIFLWLAEEMLKGEFIQWISEQGEVSISYATLGRAQERQELGQDLTNRQKKAERLAIQFRKEKQARHLAAAA